MLSMGALGGPTGQAPLGCLETWRFHVLSLLGATPWETNNWQALSYSPSLERAMADATSLLGQALVILFE